MIFLTLPVFLSFLAGWLCFVNTRADAVYAGSGSAAIALFKYANRNRQARGLVSPANRSTGSVASWARAN